MRVGSSFIFIQAAHWARVLNCKKRDVQTSPGQMGQCLHEEIEEISTLLAKSTQVSRRVTRQGGLTRLDHYFHVNAYKHLTVKVLPQLAEYGRTRRDLAFAEPFFAPFSFNYLDISRACTCPTLQTGCYPPW